MCQEIPVRKTMEAQICLTISGLKPDTHNPPPSKITECCQLKTKKTNPPAPPCMLLSVILVFLYSLQQAGSFILPAREADGICKFNEGIFVY